MAKKTAAERSEIARKCWETIKRNEADMTPAQLARKKRWRREIAAKAGRTRRRNARAKS